MTEARTMEVLVTTFNEFKRLCTDKRIYYFEGSYFFDLHFLSEGVIVKTRLIKQDINNYEQFFSDNIFYGAIRLLFNVKMPGRSITDLLGTESSFDVSDVQADELKNTDIQKEGVDDEY